MEAKAKTSNTPYPVWVYGKYITEPPVRPMDGLKRPSGHYIDEGGYPGANVSAIDMSTFCIGTAAVDNGGNKIYTKDILLYDTDQEDDIGYFSVEDEETAVDVVWGEIIELSRLRASDIKIIGNLIDFPDFVEGMGYYVEQGLNVPYLPALNAMNTALPFFKLTCAKCGHVTLNCAYVAKHTDCGGYFTADFATKMYRKKEKASA